NELPRARRERKRNTMASVTSEVSVNRESLLAHLEEEMAGQEKNWMQLQNHIRDSLTSVATTTDETASQSTSARLSNIYRRSSMIMKSLSEEASIDNTILS